MSEDHKPAIRAFLAEVFPDEQIDDDEDLRVTGLLDSLLIAQIMSFIERETGKQPGEEEAKVENLVSVNAIDALLRHIRVTADDRPAGAANSGDGHRGTASSVTEGLH